LILISLALAGVPFSQLTVGVVKEQFAGERRVAITPQNVALLLKKGFKQVLVESGAGFQAQFLDENYKAAGATLVTKDQVFSTSDILLKVRAPLLENATSHGAHEIDLVKKGSTVVSFIYPAQNPDTVKALKDKDVTLFAMDQIPRISRAQTFDALRQAFDHIHDIILTPLQFYGKYCRLQGCFRG